MARKGMKILLFSKSSLSSRSYSSSGSSPSPSPSPTARASFTESIMDRTLESSEPAILKWDPQSTALARVTSLYDENHRSEASDFIAFANNLQRAMHLMVTENPSSPKLVRAKNLMQIAMDRLQNEFYQILATNRAHLDPESLSTRTSDRSSFSDYTDENESDEGIAAGQSITEVEDASALVMADLRAIAECMISNGYAEECVKIYKLIRKSIIDEGMYKLGVEKLTPSHVRKMDWVAMDMRINSWLSAVKFAVNTLFNGEKILSDNVFASSDSIREFCFSDISKDAAMILFGFPENVAKNSRKSPEKIFRLLDMYSAISNHWPVIEATFSGEPTSKVKSTAVNSLVKIGEYVRSALAEFESEIEKSKSKSKSTFPSSGPHPLTTDCMSYLSLLADYSHILSDILATSTGPGSTESDGSGSHRVFSRLVHKLLANIDGKAKLYKDPCLSNFFLASNYRYVVVMVRSSNLKYFMGDEWLASQEAKVKQLQ